MGNLKKNSIDRQIVGKQFSGELYCKRCGNLEKVLNLEKKNWIFGKKFGIMEKIGNWETNWKFGRKKIWKLGGKIRKSGKFEIIAYQI